ncbi:odorant receptor 83a [Dendroctonus ponderosae]|uniref:odorant receptor 83a n=1 Tax=Dendroctonus ponderosae TaxID=77166 RepID=UPI002034B30E|nr:odorant receptor 83a [Dendroctonus ponderosae]
MIKQPSYEVYATDFFSVNRWILKCAGLWPPSTPNRVVRRLYQLYTIGVFLFVNLWFTGTEFVSLFYTYKSQYELIKNVNFFLTHFMGAVKVILWYFYGHLLRDIMNALESPQLHYEGYADFSPHRISHLHRAIGRRYSLLFLCLAHATLISSYIPPLIAVAEYLNQPQGGLQKLPSRLPYFCWMPFSYDTPGKYLLAVAYQAGPMFSYAYSVVGMDALFMNILNCIAENMVLIQGAFKTVRERSTLHYCVGALAPPCHAIREHPLVLRQMDLETKKIIKHLQITLRACKHLEGIYHIITLSQVTATLFILCTSLYLISTASPFSKQFFAELVYMMAMLFELFLYCWFGNEVTLKYEQLPMHIWESQWLATDDCFKKQMIFTMLRTNRPVYFTAGKLARLTLPTFMSILKTSYSIFALIKNFSK